MQYFIGIVPYDEYMDKVIRFQNEWQHLTLPELVEPHITLKAQGGLTEDEKWVEKIVNVCRHFPAFQLSLDEPRFFGDNILYLSVLSERLYKLHEQLVKAINPSKELINQYFELEHFVPHLTLGKEMFGLSKSDLQEMKNEAKRKLTPYPTFLVSFIRIYKQNSPNEKYEKYLDIPLLGI